MTERVIYNEWLARQSDLFHFRIDEVRQIPRTYQVRIKMHCLENNHNFYTITEEVDCRLFIKDAFILKWLNMEGDVVHAIPQVAAFDNVNEKTAVNFNLIELDQSITFKYGVWEE